MDYKNIKRYPQLIRLAEGIFFSEVLIIKLFAKEYIMIITID